jgi:signal transduction histidine kinase
VDEVEGEVGLVHGGESLSASYRLGNDRRIVQNDFVVTLESCNLFRQLRPEDIRFLQSVASERSLAAGTEIFREGDSGDGIYVLKEGQVEISTMQKARRVLSRIEPGEVFGEMAVIEDQPRSAGAIARQASTVYFLKRDDILKLIESSPTFSLAMLREISSRLREFNRQYLDEVLQSERLAVIGRFARTVIHDLKNPLGVIGISAEMMGVRTATPESRAAHRARIRTQIDRITEMVGDILEFTQGPQQNLLVGPMDYAMYIGQLMEELQPEAALKSSTIEVTNEPPAVSLEINPKRLRRVFYNLIYNATEAMPQGGRIQLRFVERPGEVITEVEDSGPGIAPEIAGSLFEAFATFGKEHGTGLGLSICRKIVEDHGGWIAARNEPGSGAVFSFGLPIPGPRDRRG